jgi:hypothetical protein
MFNKWGGDAFRMSNHEFPDLDSEVGESVRSVARLTTGLFGCGVGGHYIVNCNRRSANDIWHGHRTHCGFLHRWIACCRTRSTFESRRCPDQECALPRKYQKAFDTRPPADLHGTQTVLHNQRYGIMAAACMRHVQLRPFAFIFILFA